MKANAAMPASLSPALERLRVLCVDDDVAICNLLAAILRCAGHPCEAATDGREGLQKIAASTEPFDVVVTDHHMPGTNGLAFVESLWAAGFKGRIIVHSTALGAPTRAAYAALRVHGFVEKPADAATLLQTITGFAAAEPTPSE